MNKIIRKQSNQYNSIKFISEKQTQCENLNGNINQKNFQNNSKQIHILPKKFCIPSPKSIKKDKYCLKPIKNNKKINLIHSIYDQTLQQIRLNFQKLPSIQQKKIQKPKPYLKPISRKQTTITNPNQKLKKIIFSESFSDDEQKKTEQPYQQNPQQKITALNQINQINQQKQIFSDLSSENQKYIVFDSLLQRRLQQVFIENILSKQFSKQKYQKNLRWILLTPVPNQIALRFQVHIYKNLLKTEYQLWVQMQNSSELRLIATAHNPTVNLDKSIFTIQQVNLRNQKIFRAQLQSNFSRNIYNLYGYDLNYTQTIGEDQQIQQLLHIKLDKNKQMYVPIDKNRNITSYKKSLNKNLAQIYQQPNSKQIKIQKITSSNQKLNLNKNSNFSQFEVYQKKLFLQNQSDDKLMFIGKIASQKYQLLVGKNISPLQAFSFTIAHLQNR